jgi:hypothetical protein
VGPSVVVAGAIMVGAVVTVVIADRVALGAVRIAPSEARR